MALFSKSSPKNQFLGIDIGTSGIKLVELSSDKSRAKLMTYGYSERRAGETIASPFDDAKKTGEKLKKIIEASGAKSKKAMAALPSSSVFSSIISIPRRKSEKEMKPLIQAEVAKLTPIPINEMITYSTFIDPVEAEKKKGDKKKEDEQKKKGVKDGFVRVLVTGAAKTLVQKYIDIFKVAGLELQAIDTESFALIRSLIGKDRSSIMLVDIGFERTNLAIVEKGIPMMTRSINIGGNAVTKRIMQQMNTSEEEAEQVKRDLSDTLSDNDEMPPYLESIFQPIVHEMKYSFQLYENLEVAEKKKVEKIVLTGGSSHLPGITRYMADTLNMNVYRGDPFARISYPQDLRPVLDEIGPKMSVSIGLAMRDIE